MQEVSDGDPVAVTDSQKGILAAKNPRESGRRRQAKRLSALRQRFGKCI